MKTCSKCGSENPDSDYRKNSRRCKTCIKLQQAEWNSKKKQEPGFMETRRQKANAAYHDKKHDPQWESKKLAREQEWTNRDMSVKTCSKCGVEKPIEEFYENQQYCKLCAAAYGSDWHRRKSEDPEFLARMAKYNRDYSAKAKADVMAAYGSKCACCGEDRPQFLSIDHINGGGYKHRQEMKARSIYIFLRSNDFPEGFQILCFNCNCARGFFGYCCNEPPVIIPSIEGKEL